jgi:hypothetical protein
MIRKRNIRCTLGGVKPNQTKPKRARVEGIRLTDGGVNRVVDNMRQEKMESVECGQMRLDVCRNEML